MRMLPFVICIGHQNHSRATFVATVVFFPMTFSPNCISPFFQPRAQKQNQPVIAIVTVIASCRLRVVFVSLFVFVFVSSSFRCASLRVAFMSSSCRFSFLSSLRPLFVSSRFVFVHLYCEHSPLPSTRVVIPRPSVSSHHLVSFVCRQLAAPSPGLPVDFAVTMASVDDHVWNMLPLFLLVLVTLLSKCFDSAVPGATYNSNLSGTVYNQCARPSIYRMGIALGPPPNQPRFVGAPISSWMFPHIPQASATDQHASGGSLKKNVRRRSYIPHIPQATATEQHPHGD